MHETGQQFLYHLNEQEELLLPLLKGDHLGIGLVSAIREVDLFHYRLSRQEGDEHAAEQMYLLRLALPIYIRETLARVPAFKVPVITFTRDRRTATTALTLLAGIGMVEHGRRMTYASMGGLCELSCPEPRLYLFTLPAEFYDFEQQEVSVEQHYAGLARQNLKSLLAKEMRPDTEKHINQLLQEHVYIFRDRYIGYNAHPTLDEH